MQPVLAVAAAVAVVTLSVLAIVPFASTSPSADAIAVDAATATADRLAHSGRAQFSTSDSRGTEVATFAFAGDDWSMAVDGQEVARVVNDAHYVYTDDYGDDAGYQWWADGATVSNDIPDFSGLLAVLYPRRTSRSSTKRLSVIAHHAPSGGDTYGDLHRSVGDLGTDRRFRRLVG